MRENLRRDAQKVAEKFRFVLEQVGAGPGEDTFWTQPDGTRLQTLNQFLDGFSLEDCRALDEVIRKEHSDSKALMMFADRELQDAIYVKRHLRDQLQRAGLPVPLPGE